MLCSSCENQSSCLPAKLAEDDATLSEMLDHLKDCGLKARKTRPSLWQRVKKVVGMLLFFMKGDR
jgi:hypothetical protein